MNSVILIFSKDRAMQLDATLRSFLFHCKDADSAQIRILYTISDSLYEEQYERLKNEFLRYPFIQFIQEQNFHSDVIAVIAPLDHVLFLVDDNIFIRSFRLSQIIESLQQNADALGFSLRLGKNTTYCYPMDKSQRLPEFQVLRHGILKFEWPASDYDFGYPLEVSSSAYKTEDVLPFISWLPFRNPNTLEAFLHHNKFVFQYNKPALMCYEQSVTFCAPVNIVQTEWQSRRSNAPAYTPENLASLFTEGKRIDTGHYVNFTPKACHQEVDLKFMASNNSSGKEPSPVSVIIPVHPGAVSSGSCGK